MKPTNELAAKLAKPRPIKRQADHSLFANGDSAILLHFEDPAVLAFVRNATNSVLQPATSLERLFTDQLVRNMWRTIRHGNLETASIDVELADHQESVESRWGKVDPESLYHLATRESATRAAIREHSILETAALRRFKVAADILKSLKKV